MRSERPHRRRHDTVVDALVYELSNADEITSCGE